MKLHLPRLLAAAVLASLVSVPAYTAEIPDEYKDNTVPVWDADHLADYASNASTDYVAFILDIDIEVPSDISLSGGNLYFTSRNAQLPVSLEFTGRYSAALTDLSSLVFDTLSGLSFTSYKKGAISTSGNLIIQNVNDGVEDSENPDVFFSGNTFSSSYFSYGGAIYAHSGVSISGNGDVTFTGNSASSSLDSYGGAIYASEDVIISGNGDVSFTGNTASSSSSYDDSSFSYGGAIYAHSGVSISGNGDVTFTGNTVSTSSSLSFYSYGGAIYASEDVSISGNGDVSFTGNSAFSSYSDTSSSCGGAIYASGDVSISGNGDVSFTGNTVSSSSDYSSYSYSYGGAVCASGDVSISGNGDVSFTGNSASSYYSTSSGGAIFASSGGVSISGNGDVSFTGNTASSSDSFSHGGAIFTWHGDVIISGNGDVSFTGNTASSSSSSSHGGAIYAEGVSISGNGDVLFTGNSASSSYDDSSSGGAIYADRVSISGNETVCFEKNYERENSTYRLRSIYTDGNLNLSAKTGGHITFYDSVYGGTTVLNADYTDAEGNTQQAKGDIIFSGLYAKEHLDAILATNNEGRIATEGEILNSRTSNMGVTELYGGRLRIEDGAIYQGNGITVAEGANATLMLKDGTLSHAGYDITISSGSVLSAEGTNSLTASVLTIQDGGMMQLALGMAQVDGAAVLTTTGSLSMGNITFDLTGTEYLAAGEYKLLTRTEGVDYDISGWSLNGATSDQLLWKNGTLYYIGDHHWNHGVTDDDDISDLGKILGNLIINGGDITLDDVVNAIQDAVDAGFGHGQGHIVINRGGIHISGTGDLDGHIIFNGDLKDIRKLFIEKDITNIKIELGGSSEAENIVDVGGEYTVEIDSLAGDGSMSKTGEGEMVVHGHGHKVGGMLDVQEGTLTFTAGNETAGEPTGTETEVNELVVGNKKDKEAKVKVDKDTKVKGNKMQVDGQHAVVTNNGTMDFSGEVKVKKGHLENNGSISKVTLEGGKVSGSGEFAGLEMLGGELVVGNSPGLQTYTDSATFTEGSIIFSMADTDTAATSGTAGWDSSAYSTIDMDGNALMLGENVNIVLELGGAALESLVAEVNATLEFSLKLIQNIDSASLTMGAEGFAMLLDNTRILITEDSEGLTAATLHLAGLDITGMLSNAAYRYEGSTLVFSGVVTNNGTLTVPEPTTATLSLLALAALAARRRRK